MKTKISRIGKQSLSVILAIMMILSTMLVGMVSVNAANPNYMYHPKIYFDASGINVQNLRLAVIHTDGTNFLSLQHITNTDIYYYDASSYSTEVLYGIMFLCDDTKWDNWKGGNEYKGASSVTYIKNNTDWCTDALTNYDFNESNYFFTKDSTAKGAELVPNYDSSAYTKKQEVEVDVYNSGSWVQNTNDSNAGEVELSAYYWTDKSSLNKGVGGPSSATLSHQYANYTDAVLSANVTLKVNKTESGYKFLGWFDSQDKNATALSSETTYTYKNTGERKIYARFIKPAVSSLSVTSNSNEVEVNKSVTLTANSTGAPSDIKYTFSSNKGGTFSPNGTSTNKVTFTPTATGTHSITVTASADGCESVTSAPITVKVNPSTVTVKTASDDKGTVSLSGSGVVTPIAGTNNYTVKYNTLFDIKAQGKNGHVFESWNNTVTGLTITDASKYSTTAKATVDNVTASANFSTDRYHLHSTIWNSTNWSNVDFDETNPNNTVSFSENITKTGTFKLGVQLGTNGTYYKHGTITRENNSATLYHSDDMDNDTMFTADVTGMYTFTFDPKELTLTVTYPDFTKYTVSKGTLPEDASMTFSDGTTNKTEFLPNDTVHVNVTPPDKYYVENVTVDGITVTKNTNDWTFTMPKSDVTVNATFTKIDYTAKPKVSLKGTTLTEEQIEEGKDVTLTATVTPAKDADGNNVIGDSGKYKVEFYKTEKGGNPTLIGSAQEVVVTASSTTVTASIKTKLPALDKLPVTYTAKAYPAGTPSNSGESSAVKYEQKYPHSIYFDPSNEASWRNYIQSNEHEFPTVTMTIDDSNVTGSKLSADDKKYSMHIDPGFPFAKDKGVFVTKISNDALTAIQKGAKVKFVLDGYTKPADEDWRPEYMEVNGHSDVKSGSIMTMRYDGQPMLFKWSDYNVVSEAGFPRGCNTYKEFTDYLAANTKKDVVYFDNSATQWYDVYIYSWNGDNGVNAKDAFGKETVKMKRLKNFDNIWYYEIPNGGTVPDGNFLFKDRSNSYGDDMDVFGFDYQQSVDLTNTAVIRAINEEDQNMFFEDMKFDITKTVNKYKAKDSSGNEYETDVLHNPIFITAQYAHVTVKTTKDYQQGDNAFTVYNATGDAKELDNTEIKNRAFAYGWNDLWANVVKSSVKIAPVTVYFDLHNKASGNSTMEIYHKVASGYDYSSLPEKTTLRRLGNSTIYAATIQLPYNEESSELAFTFNSFKFGGNQYAMGTKSQPSFKCINTGEIWYELKSNIGSVSPINVSTKSKAKAVDSASVGAQVDSASVGAETPNTALLVPTTLKYMDALIDRVYVWYKDNGNHEPLGNWNESLFSNHTYQKVTIEGNEYYYIPFYCSAETFDFKLTSTKEDGAVQQTNEYNCASGKTWRNNQPNTNIPNSSSQINFVEYTGTIPGVSSNFYFEQWYNNEHHYSAMNKNSDGSFTIETNFANSENFRLTNTNTGDPNSATDSVSKYKLDNRIDLSTYLTIDSNTGITENGVSGFADIQLSVPDKSKTYIVKYVPGTDNELNGQITISLKSAPAEPTIKFEPSAVDIPFDTSTNSASLTLNAKVENAPDGTAVEYKLTSTTSTARVEGNVFTATAVGTYKVTATIKVGNQTYTSELTITVKAVTDVCGILAYEHATAEFSSTTGGLISTESSNYPHVLLKNGYYSATDYKTGYTKLDGDKYVTIYALAGSVKKDDGSTPNPSASFNATTVADPANTTNYNFVGWKKNGLTMADFVTNKVVTDQFPNFASKVTYLANWSEETFSTWTFKYQWYRFDRSAGVWEFKWDDTDWTKPTKNADGKITDGKNTYILDSIDITVSLSDNLDDAAILEEYYSHAPTVDDDYFSYSFSKVPPVPDTANRKVSSVATMEQPKTYEASVKLCNTNSYAVSKGYYQSAIYLTDPTTVSNGQILVWKNEKTGNILGTGNNLNIRLTGNLFIIAELKDAKDYVAQPYTTVSEPTYEAYYDTAKKQNRVRMNFLVDNYTFGNNVTEYGVLYFFCENKDGKPLDESISQDENIDKNKLIAAAQGNPSGITRRTISSSTVNAQQKYFYQPTLALTDANKKRYLRMFSYFKYTDADGAEQIVVSDPASVVIGSLSEFTPVF